MTKEENKVVDEILRKGDRVELIPTREGVEIIHIKRKKVKTITSP